MSAAPSLATEPLPPTASESASAQALYARFEAEADDGGSPTYAALYIDPSPFNVTTLQGAIQANRVGGSDMVEIRYTAPDPVLAQLTLQLLVDDVVEEYRAMKRRYYEELVRQ